MREEGTVVLRGEREKQMEAQIKMKISENSSTPRKGGREL